MCSRIAASSSAGSVGRARRVQDDVEVAAGRGSRRASATCSLDADELDLGVCGERVAEVRSSPSQSPVTKIRFGLLVANSLPLLIVAS